MYQTQNIDEFFPKYTENQKFTLNNFNRQLDCDIFMQNHTLVETWLKKPNLKIEVENCFSCRKYYEKKFVFCAIFYL